MYTKDKSNRITLRLNDKQFEFVKSCADMLGVSPSEFLRMVVNSSMASAAANLTNFCDDSISKGGLGRENDKANIDSIV